MTETQRYVMDPRDPNLIELREIARGVRNGKLVVFPTETVYGVGGPMSSPGIAEKLATLKGRAPEKPFAFHIGDLQMVEFLGVEMTQEMRFLIRTYWPGPLTLIVRNKEGQSIGLRYPNNRVTASLINTVGEPFVATSANLSGSASPRSADEAYESMNGKVELFIDSGATEFGDDSTVVDLTGEAPQILRRGAQASEIETALNQAGDEKGGVKARHILMLCTGNSCRSPMAEGILKSALIRKGLADQITVSSAGMLAARGRVASPEAVLVMKNREIDISAHKSALCTREDIVNADLIVAMSAEHSDYVTNLVPEARDKVWVLEIPDPIGMGMMIYEEVANSIERKLMNGWDRIVS